MKIFLFLLSVFLLSGCVFNNIESGLHALRGQKIETAFDYLGYPDQKFKERNETIHIWATDYNVDTVMPVTTTSRGSATIFGGGPPMHGTYSGTSTAYVPTTQNYRCFIKIVSNKYGVINRTEFQGNVGGCSNYSKALQSAAKDYGGEMEGPESANSPLFLCESRRGGEIVKWKTAKSACIQDGGRVLEEIQP